MHMSIWAEMIFNNKLTLVLFAGKESSRCKPATTRREEPNANDSFGKGFQELKDHVLNRLLSYNTVVLEELPS